MKITKFACPRLPTCLGNFRKRFTDGPRWFQLTFMALTLALILTFTFVGFCSFMFVKQLNTLEDLIEYVLPPHLPLLVDTPNCQVSDWPTFDRETRAIFVDTHNQKTPPCSGVNEPPISVTRINGTWIQILEPKANEVSKTWFCFAVEVLRRAENDMGALGTRFFALGTLTNFAANSSTPNERWDAVLVACHKKGNASDMYQRIVPLIQHYTAPSTPERSKTPKHRQVNVLLLGIDSVSRLNFLRHFPQTKAFLTEHTFQPMYGYHRVGENSFPNVMPILTGHHADEFIHKSGNYSYTFDKVPFIFKDASAQGYLTTHIEDMPGFGFFTYDAAGFKEQPTDYYLRPTNLALTSELVQKFCYQGKMEIELYYDYIYDQMEAFRERNQSYFIFNHESTTTHDAFNNAGLMDRPLFTLLSRLFANGHAQNTAIFLFADHSFRFGEALETRANLYEQSLPLFFMYLPETISLNGLSVEELRLIVQRNAHRVTSHFDLHATALHLLSGHPPSDLPYGRSLLTEIPLNRTCAEAGIPIEFCLCHSLQLIRMNEELPVKAQVAVDHINRLLAPHTNSCHPLILDKTFHAYESRSNGTDSYQLVYFSTRPNYGLYQALIYLGNSSVAYITRTDAYGQQPSCIGHDRTLVYFCYCWDVYRADFGISAEEIDTEMGETSENSRNSISTELAANNSAYSSSSSSNHSNLATLKPSNSTYSSSNQSNLATLPEKPSNWLFSMVEQFLEFAKKLISCFVN